MGVIEALASIVTEDADEGDATPDCKTRGDEQNTKTELAFKRRSVEDQKLLLNELQS